MFIMLMITTIGSQITYTQLPARYHTEAECKAAKITVAHQQVPTLNSRIGFECVREERAI